MFLTATQQMDDVFTEAITSLLKALSALFGLAIATGFIWILIVAALVTWVVKKVWYAGSKKKMNPSTGDTKKTKIGSQGPKEDRRYVLRMHHRPRLPTQSNPETYRKKNRCIGTRRMMLERPGILPDGR